jgi:hypothetical protein
VVDCWQLAAIGGSRARGELFGVSGVVSVVTSELVPPRAAAPLNSPVPDSGRA